jgi:predicted nucleotidyltransferase
MQMKTTDHIRDFLDAFVSWACDQSDVQAIALVGSYARGAAKDDSDIDLVILTDQPQKYLDTIKWTERFGSVEKHQTEDYGKLISIRVWYQNGPEVEYGITTKCTPNGLRYRRLGKIRLDNGIAPRSEQYSKNALRAHSSASR